MSISPWAYEANVESPNQRYLASVTNANEIAMGAPTSGILSIDGKIISTRCNPSIIWSNTSEYLAFPEWTKANDQKLMVYSMKSGDLKQLPKTYRVLELKQFNDWNIKGVDSPIYKSKEINVEIDF